MAEVVSIHRVAAKQGPVELLSAANFIGNFGLESDWRSRKGRGRQITLIEAEALDAVTDVLGLDDISAGASRRQVIVRGLALNATVGKKLRVGPLLVQVHDLCDPCRNMEKMIGKGAMTALEGRGGICGRVLEGGIVRPGDQVSIVADA